MGPKDATNKQIKLPPGKWIQRWSRSKPGKFYFYNDKTLETTWTRPEGAVVETPNPNESESKEGRTRLKRKNGAGVSSNQKKLKTHLAYNGNSGTGDVKPVTAQKNSVKADVEKVVSKPNFPSLPALRHSGEEASKKEDSSASKHLHIGNVDSSVVPNASKKKRRRRSKKKSSQKVPTTSGEGSTNNETVPALEQNNRADSSHKHVATLDVDTQHAVTNNFIAVTPIVPCSESGSNFSSSSNRVPSTYKSFKSVDTKATAVAVNTSKKSFQSAASRNVASVTIPSPCHELNINKCQNSPMKVSAQNRLKRLQEKLHTKEQVKVSRNCLVQLKDLEKLVIPKLPRKIVEDSLSPAAKRLVQLQEKLKSGQNENDKFLPSSCEPQGNELPAQLPIVNNAQDCEAMEVEYMESEVLFDIEQLRQKDVNVDVKLQPIFMDVDMDCPMVESDNKSILYIVLDTNILLSHLKFTAELRDSVLPGSGPFNLYVPWQVLHELDHLKDKGKSSIQPLARRAINYLHVNFSSKHPRVRGQKLSEALQNPSNCADDNILQSCLQLKQQGCNVILLSNDKNLCNKALVCDVNAACKDQFSKLLYTGMKNNTDNMQKDADKKTHINVNDFVICKLKAIIKDALTKVVSRGMEDEYKHLWKNCTIIPPPWETDDVLHCLGHHWLPICGDFTPPLVRDSIVKLRGFLKSIAKSYCSNLLDIKESLELSRGVFGAISKKYRSIVDVAILKVKELEIMLSNNDITNISSASAEELNDRDLLVLNCFEEAHNAAISICVESLADPDLFQKAGCMLGAVRTLMHLLKLLLATPVGSLSEDDPVVNELVCLIKGSNSITPSDLTHFCKKDSNRTLIENGITQFASFEVRLTDLLQMTM